MDIAREQAASEAEMAHQVKQLAVLSCFSSVQQYFWPVPHSTGTKTMEAATKQTKPKQNNTKANNQNKQQLALWKHTYMMAATVVSGGNTHGLNWWSRRLAIVGKV
ncbi:unnamed protein product [Polarella glacialis]|uniref:Uncharacterized protein n=1 Tax=Polarella glacialis TaxID=89957 RepID=A0A813EN93_POLGL|nr:unnamed protein product [Polarella glacialis]CAE8678665.1 unnamed protein product [Polarella glacialis]